MLWLFHLPRLDRQHDQREDKEEDADPLGGGQPEEEAADLVAAEKLRDEPHHRVDEHIDVDKSVFEDGFFEQIEQQQEDEQVAGALDELDREAVDVVDRGIDRIVVNGEAEFALHTVAAAAQKTADTAENVEQGREHRVDIEDVVAVDPHAFVELGVDQNTDTAADKAAVEDDAAEAVFEHLPQLVNAYFVDMSKVVDEQADVRHSVYKTGKDQQTDHRGDHRERKVVDIDIKALDQPRADQKADGKSDDGHHAVHTDLSAENLEGWEHFLLL